VVDVGHEFKSVIGVDRRADGGVDAAADQGELAGRGE
jgi:hypothetical protein